MVCSTAYEEAPDIRPFIHHSLLIEKQNPNCLYVIQKRNPSMHHLPPMQNAYNKNQRQDRDIEVFEIRKRARQGSYSSLVVLVTVVVTTVARSSSIAAFASALSTSIRLFLAKSVARPVVIIHLLCLTERKS
jgi:hypothetical protein